MARGFVDVLKDIRTGGAVDELDTLLPDLIAAVRDSGRAGKLTLTITVKPASKGDGNTLMVDDAIAVKKPTREKGTTIFFANNENGLQRNDPRQPELKGLRPAAVATFTTTETKEAATS